MSVWSVRCLLRPLITAARCVSLRASQIFMIVAPVPLDAGISAAPAPTAPAVSLSFNPFFPKVFLAAHEGGSAAMYSTDSSLALQRWVGITPGDVVAVRWSLARPSLFFILDDRCYITTFDLLSKTPTDPTHVEQFGKKERIVSFQLAKAGGGSNQKVGAVQVESSVDP